MRTRGVLEFIEEFDSKDTCLGHQGQVGTTQCGLSIAKGMGWYSPQEQQGQVHVRQGVGPEKVLTALTSIGVTEDA